MTMPDDEDLFKSKPLVIPAKINIPELERLRNVLLSQIGEIDTAIAEAERHPVTSMRYYMSTLATLSKVCDAAISHGSRAWKQVGMRTTELAQILDQPRTTVTNRMKRSKKGQLDEVLSEAEHKRGFADQTTEEDDSDDKGDNSTERSVPMTGRKNRTRKDEGARKSSAPAGSSLGSKSVIQDKTSPSSPYNDEDYEVI